MEPKPIPIFRACLHPSRLWGYDVPMLLPVAAMGMFYFLALTQMTVKETMLFPVIILSLAWLIRRYSASDFYWRQVMLRQYNYTRPWKTGPRYFPATSPLFLEIQHRKQRPRLVWSLRGIGVVLLGAALLMALYGPVQVKFLSVPFAIIGYSALRNAALSAGGLRPLHDLPWLDPALMR